MPTLITAGDATSAASSFTASNDGALNIVVGPAGGKLTAFAMDAAGALTTVAGRRVFSQGNILGAVSQAAGVPTGAVIERGSNANGEFVRFADGTQICTHTLPTLAVAATSFTSHAWTFPAAFIVTPQILPFQGIPDGSGDVYGYVYRAGASATSATQVFRNGATAQNVVNTQAVAIGRWF